MELGLLPAGYVSDTSQAAGTVEFMVKRVEMVMLKVSVLVLVSTLGIFLKTE